MLGEKLGELRGKTTGFRVLPSEDGSPKVEVSFQGTGKILGLDTTDMGTYSSIQRPDGSLFGEGQGLSMTAEGDVATWSGRGIGRFTGHGTAVSWRGVLFYQTQSERLARLNAAPVVFEYEVDEEGNTRAQTWEWK